MANGRKRSRCSNWSHEATMILAELKKEAFLNKEEGGLVWKQIAQTIFSRFPDQVRSNDQCRRRWDTLTKDYNHIEGYCIQTGQDHWQLDEDELTSMKLDTAYRQDWYNIVRQVCSQRKRKERSGAVELSKRPNTGSHSVGLLGRSPGRDSLHVTPSQSSSELVITALDTHHEHLTAVTAQISTTTPSLEVEKLSTEEKIRRLKGEKDALIFELNQLRQHIIQRDETLLKPTDEVQVQVFAAPEVRAQVTESLYDAAFEGRALVMKPLQDVALEARVPVIELQDVALEVRAPVMEHLQDAALDWNNVMVDASCSAIEKVCNFETNLVPPAMSRSGSVRLRWRSFVWLICACNRFSHAAAARLRAKKDDGQDGGHMPGGGVAEQLDGQYVLSAVEYNNDSQMETETYHGPSNEFVCPLDGKRKRSAVINKYSCEVRISKIPKDCRYQREKVWLGTYATPDQAGRALDVGKYFLCTKKKKIFYDPNSEAMLSAFKDHLQALPLTELVKIVVEMAMYYGENGSLPVPQSLNNLTEPLLGAGGHGSLSSSIKLLIQFGISPPQSPRGLSPQSILSPPWSPEEL